MSNDLDNKRVEHELFLRAFLPTKPSDRVAAELSRVTRDVHLDQGAVLFEAGQAAERLHFVASGRIQLTTPDGTSSTADAGSLLGMLDASIPRPRRRTAIALEQTHVVTLDFDDYLDILEGDFGFAIETLRSGAEGYCELVEHVGDADLFEPTDGAPVSRDRELDVVERILILQHVGMFRGAPAQSLVQLAHSAAIKHWRSGDTLFSSGDGVTKLHLVASGIVVTHRHDERVVAEFGPQQIVGDLEVLGRRRHEAWARARTPAVTIDLEVEDLFDIAEDHFDLWRSMLSYVARQRARVNESASGSVSALWRTTF